MMKKIKFVDIVLIILALFVAIMMFKIFMILDSNAKDCLSNSFVYGSNNQIKGGGFVYCSCTQTRDDGEVFPFEFNNTGLRIIPVNKQNLFKTPVFRA